MSLTPALQSKLRDHVKFKQGYIEIRKKENDENNEEKEITWKRRFLAVKHDCTLDIYDNAMKNKKYGVLEIDCWKVAPSKTDPRNFSLIAPIVDAPEWIIRCSTSKECNAWIKEFNSIIKALIVLKKDEYQMAIRHARKSSRYAGKGPERSVTYSKKENANNVEIESIHRTSKLIESCEVGDTKIVKSLLEQNTDPSNCFIDDDSLKVSSTEEKFPLLACMNSHQNITDDHLECTRLLIEAEANVNAVTKSLKYSALMRVCMRREPCPEMVNLLLKSKANVQLRDHCGYDALMKSLNLGHHEISKTLIDSKASLGVRASISNDTPLIIASKHPNCVKLLLNSKAHVTNKNAQGDTALHFAVTARSHESVKILLEEKAEVNKTNKLGRIALCSADDPEMVNMLIEAGSDTYITDFMGKTPLHLAASNGHYKVLDTLLDYENNVNIQNYMGHTICHSLIIYVDTNGNYDPTHLLHKMLAQKLALNIRDNNGKTAEDLCKSNEMNYYFKNAIASYQEIIKQSSLPVPKPLPCADMPDRAAPIPVHRVSRDSISRATTMTREHSISSGKFNWVNSPSNKESASLRSPSARLMSQPRSLSLHAPKSSKRNISTPHSPSVSRVKWWICSICSNRNPKSVDTCNKCGAESLQNSQYARKASPPRSPPPPEKKELSITRSILNSILPKSKSENNEKGNAIYTRGQLLLEPQIIDENPIGNTPTGAESEQGSYFDKPTPNKSHQIGSHPDRSSLTPQQQILFDALQNKINSMNGDEEEIIIQGKPKEIENLISLDPSLVNDNQPNTPTDSEAEVKVNPNEIYEDTPYIVDGQAIPPSLLRAASNRRSTTGGYRVGLRGKQ